MGTNRRRCVRMFCRDCNEPDPWKKFSRDLSLTHITVLVFAASSLIYALSPQGRPEFFDLRHGAEETRIALTLARQGDFAHPYFALPTGPTAHAAPAYVLLYALVAKLLGIGLAGATVLWALNVGFLALQLALLPALSSRLGLGIGPGLLAAAFGVVVQPYRVLLEWEALLTGALLVILCVVTIAYFKARQDWGHSALLGFLWGVAILTNPECVLLLFAWSHIAAMENSPEMLSRSKRCAMSGERSAAQDRRACPADRNHRQFHAVLSTISGFKLLPLSYPAPNTNVSRTSRRDATTSLIRTAIRRSPPRSPRTEKFASMRIS